MATNGTARQPRSKRRKDTLRYYNQSDWMRPTGLGAIIAAVVLFYFGWTYVSYILASLLMPGGLFLFFYASVRHTSDADVEKERETPRQDLPEGIYPPVKSVVIKVYDWQFRPVAKLLPDHPSASDVRIDLLRRKIYAYDPQVDFEQVYVYDYTL